MRPSAFEMLPVGYEAVRLTEQNHDADLTFFYAQGSASFKYAIFNSFY